MQVDKVFIERATDEVLSDVIQWRRHFHENPELSFREVETAQYIYDVLNEIEHLTLIRPTRTSVIARLTTDKPGMTLALRADIDALPIQEENDMSFKSGHDGVMHACGHDGHTAMLLGAVRILSKYRDKLSGEYLFIFQHAEELVPGGARELVDAGILDNVDAIVGEHLWQPLAAQKIGLSSGPVMASPDTFYIRVNGRGGHAGRPQENIDPIVIGAQIVTSLQNISSRYVDPFDPFVLSVTKFNGGTADNVTPNSVELAGTVRVFREALRDEAARWIEQVSRGIVQAHGATCDVRYERGYAPVVNDQTLTETVRSVLLSYFGEEMVQDADPIMFGEDFSAYQQVIPGTFLFTGIFNEDKDVVYPHHHPKFNIDEDSLQVGLQALIAIAMYLPSMYNHGNI